MKVLPYPSLSTYEGSIIWRFLDGFPTAVSSRMLRGSPPGEENLTFLLCVMLDESSAGSHVLEYPLASAKEDLEKSDAGITIDVEFQTDERFWFSAFNYWDGRSTRRRGKAPCVARATTSI